MKFLILGNMNASTYKEIWPHVMRGTIWYGPSITSGDRAFHVPDTYPLEATGCGVDADGRRYIRVKGVRWFTNMDHDKRHVPLPLRTRAENLKSIRGLADRNAYVYYDNYAAIEVPKTVAIPSDVHDVMGVPVTFLDKYCPEQFELLGVTESQGLGLSNGLRVSGPPQALIHGKSTYVRIFIRPRTKQ